MIDLTYFEYRAAIREALAIEEILAQPDRRKDVRLILRHMLLTSRIHAYEAAREALAQQGRAA